MGVLVNILYHTEKLYYEAAYASKITECIHKFAKLQLITAS